MFCNICLQKLVNKLLPDDILILEYLKSKNANNFQQAISRNTIKTDLEMTDHQCYTSIAKLENFEIISRQFGKRSSRYYITDNGEKSLRILENKLLEVKR